MSTDNITPINAEELKQAEEEAKDAKGMFVMRFKKPISYNGKEYSELAFDFESLTGRDSLDVEKELTRSGTQIVVPAFNGEYLVRIAARACTTRVGYDVVYNMSIIDYNKLRSAVRNFLMRSES